MKKHALSVLIGLSSAALLTACGGSSSGSGDASAQVTRGTVDGFGSVIVNGIRFNTDATEFDVKEQAGSQNQLRVGQVVTIVGSHNGASGVASRIAYDVSLEGPVSSVDAAAGTFVVLGQTVTTTSLTVFEDLTLDTLAVDARVEVSGFVGADGQLLASFVELDDDADGKAELRGEISNLDEGAQTFTVRTQLISYADVAEWDLEGAALANGLLVEVEGSVNAEGTLVANKVEAEDDDRFERDTEVKLKGLISSVNAEANQFVVNGVTVLWNNRTEFDDLLAADLAANLMVEVEGRTNADGVLVAEEVEAEERVEISIEAPLSAISLNPGSNFTGSVEVLGLNVAVDLRTRMRDNDDDDNYNPLFNLSDLTEGDYVELRITGDAETGYRALRLERDNADAEDGVKLEAPVTSVNLAGNRIVVLGVEVDITAVLASVPGALAAGMEVEVSGSFSAGVLTATEFEADDEHEGSDD
jgi:hypothetical protein